MPKGVYNRKPIEAERVRKMKVHMEIRRGRHLLEERDVIVPALTVEEAEKAARATVAPFPGEVLVKGIYPA